MERSLIPLSKPFFDHVEEEQVIDALRSGWVTQGPKVQEFEGKFREYVGSTFACAVSNCTVALQGALLASGVKTGDVVITASHSFIATANCIRACGAEPIFIDVEHDSPNICPTKLSEFLENECISIGNDLYFKNIESLFFPQSALARLFDLGVSIKSIPRIGRIAAIQVVHQVGIPCAIEQFAAIGKKYNIPVIEDAACAIGSAYKTEDGHWNRIGNSKNSIVCFSFHPRKLLTTGDGGIICTDSESHDSKFRSLRHHGMSVSDLVRHAQANYQVEEYKESGFNFRMTDVQAAVGLGQISKIDLILERRQTLFNIYSEISKRLKNFKIWRPSSNIKWNIQTLLLCRTSSMPFDQSKFLNELRKKGIAAKGGIVNAHEQTAYNGKKWDLPQSEFWNTNSIALPLFHTLKEEEIEYIVETIKHIEN